MRTKLLLSIGLIAATCNLYGMGAGDAKSGDPAVEKKSPDGVVHAAAAPAGYVDVSTVTGALAELAKFTERSPKFVDLLHTWARDAQLDFLRAAFQKYKRLDYTDCDNSDHETLIDSANKASEDLPNKQACIKYLSALQAGEVEDEHDCDPKDNFEGYRIE